MNSYVPFNLPMTSVYRIRANLKHYTHIMPARLSFHGPDKRSLVTFDGSSKIASWGSDRNCYMLDPTRPPGDFAGFSTHALAVRVEAFERASLSDFFHSKCAELLPLKDEANGSEWYVLNITCLCDCVDFSKTVFELSPYREAVAFISQKLDQNV
ncbi:MAG TPA: hypothetical protein VHM90_08775, partial [Phycisphaerae bacterium]|nr:hypothetical protein [Phycisphaerae bacterium]